MGQPGVIGKPYIKNGVSFIMKFNFMYNNFMFMKNVFDWMLPFLNIAYNRDLACQGTIHRQEHAYYKEKQTPHKKNAPQ